MKTTENQVRKSIEEKINSGFSDDIRRARAIISMFKVDKVLGKIKIEEGDGIWKKIWRNA